MKKIKVGDVVIVENGGYTFDPALIWVTGFEDEGITHGIILDSLAIRNSEHCRKPPWAKRGWAYSKKDMANSKIIDYIPFTFNEVNLSLPLNFEYMPQE